MYGHRRTIVISLRLWSIWSCLFNIRLYTGCDSLLFTAGSTKHIKSLSRKTLKKYFIHLSRLL